MYAQQVAVANQKLFWNLRVRQPLMGSVPALLVTAHTDHVIMKNCATYAHQPRLYLTLTLIWLHNDFNDATWYRSAVVIASGVLCGFRGDNDKQRLWFWAEQRFVLLTKVRELPFENWLMANYQIARRFFAEVSQQHWQKPRERQLANEIGVSTYNATTIYTRDGPSNYATRSFHNNVIKFPSTWCNRFRIKRQYESRRTWSW